MSVTGNRTARASDIRVSVPWAFACPFAVLNCTAAVMELAALHPLVGLPPLASMTGATAEIWPLWAGSMLREDAEMAA